jgi:hypothetical protein
MHSVMLVAIASDKGLKPRATQRNMGAPVHARRLNTKSTTSHVTHNGATVKNP